MNSFRNNIVCVLFIILLLSFVIQGSAPNISTGTIAGTCYTPDTSDWSGIIITVVGQNKSAITNSQGKFTLTNITPGLVTVQAGKLLFRNSSVQGAVVPDETLHVNLDLTEAITDTFSGISGNHFTSATTNAGNIGIPQRFIEARDSGFSWNGIQQLKEASLMIGVDTSRVSDAARFILGLAQDNLDMDFQSRSDIVLISSGVDSIVHTTSFDDSRSNQAPGVPSQPLYVDVTQTTSSYSDNDFLIVKLNIKNMWHLELQNLVVGWFVDWNVGASANTNRGGVISVKRQLPAYNNGNPFSVEIAYQKMSSQSGPFMGIVPLSQGQFRAARVASLNNEIIPTRPYRGLTEANKYRYMSEMRKVNPNSDYGIEEDLCTIVGLGGLSTGNCRTSKFTLLPKTELCVGFAFVGGNDSLEFVNNALKAQDKWIAQGNLLDVPLSTWQVTAGWSMISLPVNAEEKLREILFPNAISDAHIYSDSGYVSQDSMRAGLGYWLKFPSTENVEIIGTIRKIDTVSVMEGWNLIGMISYPVAVNSLQTEPPGIIMADIFDFGIDYFAVDTLYPAKAYWVRVSQPGKIILKSPD